MAIYKCTICGYIFDEEKEGKPFSTLGVCPFCKQPLSKFERIDAPEPTKPVTEEPVASAVVKESQPAEEKITKKEEIEEKTADKDELYNAEEFKNARYMAEIHEMAATGRPISSAMGTQLPLPMWEDILLCGGQLSWLPLSEDDKVTLRTTIGSRATKPMVLEGPVFISHMSFGALSREAKIALAKGSAMAKTAMCSGEGGILPEEQEAAYKYIFEYVPNKYSATNENLKAADAIEIKIGQGTKPGMGGHLPGVKVTEEIAAIRGKKPGEDIQSHGRFESIQSGKDLKKLVSQLRRRSEGRPIGIKIAAEHIEADLELCVLAEPDFITIDGRGGATASSPFMIREATTVPTIYALSRARKYLDSVNADIDLVITGGLRVSADFAKAIALGADAIAVASAAMMAAGCQQYRICGSGRCPFGIATQDPELRKRFPIEEGAKRVANYLQVSFRELEMFGRITGHRDIHELGLSDLVTTNEEIHKYTGIAHVGESK